MRTTRTALRAPSVATALMLVILASGCGDDPVADQAAANVAPSDVAGTPSESAPDSSSPEQSSSESPDCDSQAGSLDLSCLEGEQVRLAPANAAPPQSDIQRGVEFSGTVQQYLTLIVDDVETAWSRWFKGRRLAEPTVTKVIIDPGSTATTRCDLDEDGNAPDTVAADFNNAFYCPTDLATDAEGVEIRGAVVLPVLTFERMWTGDVLGRQSRVQGDFAAAVVTAHELGHHIQDELWTQLPLENRFTGANQENLADCFAGVWMASAYADGLLTDTDYEEAVAALEALGADNPDMPHGTPDERREALELGYTGGTDGVPGVPAVCIDAYDG